MSITSVDGAGNGVGNARDVGLLSAYAQTILDSVGGSDSNDYYRFSLDTYSAFYLSLSGLSGDVDVVVYDSEGTRIAQSMRSGDSDESVSIAELAPGDYFVRVFPYAGAESDYNLSLSAAPLQSSLPVALAVGDDPGETMQTARDIGVLSADTQTFNDSVSSADNNDFYRFTLNEASDLRLALSGLSADADVAIYNSSGTRIAGSFQSGSNNESIELSGLAAGDYYVRVFPYAGAETNYSLSLSAEVADTENVVSDDAAGNSRETARDIGVLSADTQTFTDSVSSSDSNDYYRFTLDQASDLSLSLSGMTADADVVVYNAAGERVGGSFQGGSNSESIELSALAAGNYYVRVYPYGSAQTSYSLSLSTAAADSDGSSGDEDGAGNSREDARNVGSLTAAVQTFSDSVSSSDSNDYYRFTLDHASNLHLSLSGLNADADVVVFNFSGVRVGGSFQGGSNSESIELSDLAAGDYYVRVYPYGGAATNYSLSLSADAVGDAPEQPGSSDNAGNTRETARDIGVLSADTQTFSDSVSSTDSNDYYKFVLEHGSSLSLSLTGMTADADVAVYTAAGVRVAGSYFSGTHDESIELPELEAGIYYVRVYPYGGAQTNYTLSLEAETADSAGNTREEARDIGVLGANALLISENINSADSDDYYRFSINQNSDFRLVLTGLSANADVSVYNSSGKLLSQSNMAGENNERISIDNLPAGDYYVRVNSVDSLATDYSLKLYADPVVLSEADAADVAGNRFSLALDLGLLADDTLTYDESLNNAGNNDKDDFYRFTLDEYRDVSLSLTGLSDNLDLVLYDQNQIYLDVGMTGGSSDESIDFANLPPGTYYVRVSSYYGGNSSDYTLSLSSSEPSEAAPTPATEDNAGNDFVQARDIGVVGVDEDVQFFSDWVGHGDSEDFYKFTLQDSANLHLALVGASPSADIELYDADGKLFASDAYRASYTPAIEYENLAAGTYYVKVFAGNVTRNGDYSLAIRALQGDGSDPHNGIQDNVNNISKVEIAEETDDSIENLLCGNKWGSSQLGTGVTLTYSFSNSDSVYSYAGNNGQYWEMSDGQKAVALLAMQKISSICGISFVEVEDSATLVGDIRWTAYNSATTCFAYLPDANSQALSGDIWMGNAAVGDEPAPGSFGYHATLHELGHALGLNHPFSPTNAVSPVTDEDIGGYSIMSYNNYPGAISFNYMLNDISALQHLYGSNNTYNNGDNTYSWNSDKVVYECIWDSGGVDTIDASNQSAACSLDLRDGEWSEIGVGFDKGGGVIGRDNLSLAYGVEIENAIGSDHDDTIIGNDLNNQLIGGKGSDTLTGGDGADEFVFRNALDAGDVLVDFNSGEDLIIIDADGFNLQSSSNANLVTEFSGNNAQFKYSSTDGKLWYDQDGAGSEHQAVLLATLQNNEVISADDIKITSYY